MNDAGWWWIVGGSVGFLVLLGAFLVVTLALVLRVVVPKLRARVTAAFPAGVQLEDLWALSFGLTSRGLTQGRGNGALVLTESVLQWLQLVPASSDVQFHSRPSPR